MRWYLMFMMVIGLDALADDAIVGTGSAASCTTVASHNAVAAVDLGQAPGGKLRFNCGPSPHTILVNGQSFLNSQTTVDVGDRIILDGNSLRRIFGVAPRSPGDQTEVTITVTRANHWPPHIAATIVNTTRRLPRRRSLHSPRRCTDRIQVNAPAAILKFH